MHKLFETVVGFDDAVQPTLNVDGELDEAFAGFELGGFFPESCLAIARVLSDAEEERL